MELEDAENEKLTSKFQFKISMAIERWKQANPGRKLEEAPWGVICRNSLLAVVWWDVTYVAVINCVSDLLCLFYIYWTQRIINWIVNPTASKKEGAILCAIFTAAAFTSCVLKGSIIQNGLIMGVKIRKILVSALYDKLGKLSMKAVTSTNSGKLITLVSGDIFMIERGLAFSPMVISAPFTNIAVMILVVVTSHWSNSIIIFVFYMLMLLLQTLSGMKQKNEKIQEGMQNDQRIKLVSDMVNGIRTIKSYGWENHYKQKIEEARSKQTTFIWRVNFYSSLGLTVFNNFGFYAFLAIVLCTYWRGVELKAGEAMATLSILFFLFMSVNGITVYALNTTFQFFGVMVRIGDVFKLSEHQSTRQVANTPEEVCIKVTDGSYSWGFKVRKDKNQSALKDRLDLEEDQTAVLSDVNFELKHDDTLVVVGKIGSGKTTLLHSLMDETVKLAGSTLVRGKVAYVE